MVGPIHDSFQLGCRERSLSQILVETTFSLVVNFADIINVTCFYALPAGVAADSAARPCLPFRVEFGASHQTLNRSVCHTTMAGPIHDSFQFGCSRTTA